MRSGLVRSGLAAVLAGVIALALPVPASGRPSVELEVTLDPAARQVQGEIRIRLVNVSHTPLRDVPLWLYPNHLSERDRGLGDVSFHWFYPGSFSPGSMLVSDTRVDGAVAAYSEEDTPAGPRTVGRVQLPRPLPPGESVCVTARFTTIVPRRLGAFGCAKGHCRLMLGFHPLTPDLGPEGWRMTIPSRMDLAIRARAGSGVLVVNDRVVPAHDSGRLVFENVPGATLIHRPQFRESVVATARTQVRYLHDSARPPPASGLVLPYVREDVPGLVLSTVERGLRFLEDQGLSGSAGELLLVEAPLRHELAQPHGRVVLVSDRIFRLFPVETLRRFHSLELLRGVYTARFMPVLAPVEPDEDLEMAAAVVSGFLLDLFALREYRRVEYARELLNPFDFVPVIDQMIQAPLMASAHTYFGEVDDAEVVKDDARAVFSSRPRGRFVYQKLVDLLGPADMARLVRRMVATRVPLRTAAAEEFGGDLSWFWTTWLEERPRVNYRLKAVEVEPLPRGARVSVVVERQGDDVREPVEVRIVDRAGGIHNLTWREPGREKRMQVDLPARLALVEVDPRRRLTESGVGSLGPEEHPRVDNRRPLRLQVLYSGFGALLNVTDLSANLLALFTIKRQHDLRQRMSLYAIHSESTRVGAGASYARLFGSQINRNQLSSSLFGGARVDRLEPAFGQSLGGEPTPGWRFSASVGADHDTRDYIIDPWSAIGVYGSIGYTLTRLDDGLRLSQVGLSAEALRLLELAPGHVLALDVDAAATFGDIRIRPQLVRAGGPGGLRGFASDELLARARVVARLELRNRYVSDLDWNLGHFTWVRGFGGTLFVDGAALSGCDDYRFERRGLFFDAGYSFRVLHDALGVHQQLLSVDVAVPLNRHARDCFGLDRASRRSVTVMVSFLPGF